MMSRLNAQPQDGAVPSPPGLWNGAEHVANTRQRDQLGLGVFGCAPHASNPLECYDIKTTGGKEGPGTVFPKKQRAVQPLLFALPLCGGAFCICPTCLWSHLHLPICISHPAFPHLLHPQPHHLQARGSRWRGHPSQRCFPFILGFWEAIPHEKCRILLPPPLQSSSSLAPLNYCSKALPRAKKWRQKENFLLEESCEGTKRGINCFCGSVL